MGYSALKGRTMAVCGNHEVLLGDPVQLNKPGACKFPSGPS